jgi:hypothetical protein
MVRKFYFLLLIVSVCLLKYHNSHIAISVAERSQFWILDIIYFSKTHNEKVKGQKPLRGTFARATLFGSIIYCIGQRIRPHGNTDMYCMCHKSFEPWVKIWWYAYCTNTTQWMTWCSIQCHFTYYIYEKCFIGYQSLFIRCKKV